MTREEEFRPVEILLVEDNPGDIRLTVEAFKEGKIRNHLSVSVRDGVDALDFLRQQGPLADAPRPDLILLDLNLPRKNGRDVLAEGGRAKERALARRVSGRQLCNPL